MTPVVVGISEVKFAQKPAKLITYGLGSCVAIVLFSVEVSMASMAHVMLPMAFEGKEDINPAKYADTAVLTMMEEMEKQGVHPQELVAKIAGGADMFAGKFKGSGRRIGTRNILATRKALDYSGIRLVAQDVGGIVGRSVEFSTDTGTLLVKTLKGGRKEI